MNKKYGKHYFTISYLFNIYKVKIAWKHFVDFSY